MTPTTTNGIAALRDVETIEARAAPPLPRSTYEAIERSAERTPGAPALSFFATLDAHRTPQRWSYRELLARITQTANLFHRLGATKETVIAIALPNLPETHFAIWGAEATGIAMPLNPLLEGSAIAGLIAAAGAEILVTLAPRSGAIWERIEPALAASPSLRHVVLVGPREDVPRLPERIAVSWLAEAEREVSSHLVSARVHAPSDASSWFATGGTTGLPKLAMRTHGNEVANAWSTGQAIGDAIGPGAVVLCGLPLFHVNAVLVTGLLPFSRGAHVLLATAQGYRTPGLIARFWEIVEHHRVSFFSGVPTLYGSLLDVPVGDRDLRSLEYGLCGAAPMPSEVLRTFEARTGVRILEGYGLTEATCVSSINPIRGERRVGSIGLRLPGQRMKAAVLDERGRFVRDCDDGEVGAILVSGPNVFVGYRNPAQNAALWIDCGDGLRWLDTGDLGRRDADGYFWLTGRRKELIIRGGHNIDPAAIEEPLHEHPAVQVAAAVGRPDAHAGEVPVAYVQLRPGAVATEAELLEHAASRIAERAAVPTAVRIVPQMPVTAVGKIFKPELKRREAITALSAALEEAGLGVTSIAITTDPARGMLACVALESGSSRELARHVLGRFAIAWSLDP